MDILTKIIQYKTQEVAQKQIQTPIAALEKSPYFDRQGFSLKKSLQEGSGIIAEIKRKSPSKGFIHKDIVVEDIAKGYAKAGVSGISILTDEHFFGGQNRFLTQAREQVKVPLLRKDFIINEYQLMEAKAIGADVILLIAAALEAQQLKQLAKFAHALGLEVLMEVHNQTELEQCINEHVDMVGVNNRNLKDFRVSIQTSIDLSTHIPDEFVKVSESGISNPQTIQELKQHGFQGFLIGEHFMKHEVPEQACQVFIEEVLGNG